jgi:hypothetical protein
LRSPWQTQAWREAFPSTWRRARRLTQVLINLVGNAIKFTDAGEVAIKVEATDGQFRVSVRDTGPGISAADHAKLFQEFHQAVSLARRAALAWDWPYRSASLRCTAAESGSRRNPAKVRHLPSHSRFTLSVRWSPYEQAHSGGRGSTR